MTSPVPGAVLDCVVLLQAAISRKGPAFAFKQLLDAGKFALFLSPEVLAELTDVLNRPKLRRKFKHFTTEKAEAFLSDLTSKATSLTNAPKQFAYARDPDDESYVNLALAARAQHLVTWDNDLLDLMADNPGGADFRQRFPGLVVLTPVAFLRALSQVPGKSPDTETLEKKTDN